MAVNEDENRVVMAAVVRDVKRAILRRRLRLAFQWLVVLFLVCTIVATLFQNFYQNDEIPFLRRPIYTYMEPFFGATAPNPGATFSAVWLPSPAGSSDLNTPITLQLALYGPFASQAASSPFIYGKQKPLILSPIVHTSSWENQNYTAQLIVPLRLAPGYYIFVAISLNGMLGSSVVLDETYLPCHRFIFGPSYPGDFTCFDQLSTMSSNSQSRRAMLYFHEG